MRTKKQELHNQKVVSFVGKLVETRFVPFADSYAQELEVKSAKATYKLIFPFVKPHEFKVGEERRWFVVEKETVVVSYSVAKPDNLDESKISKLKKFWADSRETTIKMKLDNNHTFEWTCLNFIPYVRKAKRVTYFEIINEKLDASFFTDKVKQKPKK